MSDKDKVLLYVIWLLTVIGMGILGVVNGYEYALQEVENRAMELPDPCYEVDHYSWQDIEYVVFGDTQE